MLGLSSSALVTIETLPSKVDVRGNLHLQFLLLRMSTRKHRPPAPSVRRPRPWIAAYGDPSVEFVNTRWFRLGPTPRETLRSIEDLLDWLEMKGVVDSATYGRWSARLRRSPSLARQVLQEALDLREAIHGIYWALVQRLPAQRSHLKRLNESLAAAVSHPVVLVSSPRVFSLGHERRDTAATALVAPIALCAAELLTDGTLARLHRCSNDLCGLLFVDRTKSGRRRWCDMARCGARSKMREYRRRLMHRRQASSQDKR